MGKCFLKLTVCLTLVGSAGYGQTLGSATTPETQPGARQLVLLANQARAAKGLSPLKWDPALAAAAARHCLRMAAEGPIAHRYRDEPSLADRASEAGAHFSLIEENVAIGPTPEAIHEEWMHSPGHYANLMNPKVDAIGVALVAKRGVWYAVADYEREVPVLSRSQVETAIARLIRVAGLTIDPDPSEARAACPLSRGLPIGFTGPLPALVIRWESPDLTHLPKQLVDQLESGTYHRAALGSCAPKNATPGFTSYRLAVLLY